ncbi:MAG: dihydroorotate dehydrogenase electron transfer subunit [Bacillota bacterium]
MPSRHRSMLPRPFSIFNAHPEKGELSFFIEIKGPGTSMLAAAKKHDSWLLLGPLGNGFPAMPEGSLLVAGGVGIAPLVFLAASTEKERVLIYGAPTASLLTCPSGDLDLPGLTVLEATEDGSRGEKGTALDLLAGKIKKASAIFSCGPCGMLAAVKHLGSRYGIPAWVSVEEQMACGIGACVGCVINTTKGYRRVCRDGPVFPVEEVVFDEQG